MSAPNCQRCRHYFVTWDPGAPKGCRAHGFKSPESPAQLVFASSGIRCQLFEEKPHEGSETPEAAAEDPLNPKDTFVRRR